MKSGSFQISSVDLDHMSSDWCSYKCARTSRIMDLFWHPPQFIDYIDFQALGLDDVGYKFHEGIYHLAFEFCL